MKDFNEMKERLKSELEQWYIKQCRDPYADFYLYHVPSSPERNGGFLICKENPPNRDYVLSSPQRIDKSLTPAQNYSKFYDVLRQLPVLDV
jgi:hypothetical protein